MTTYALNVTEDKQRLGVDDLCNKCQTCSFPVSSSCSKKLNFHRKHIMTSYTRFRMLHKIAKQHRGKTSAHAREQKMAKSLNSTFVNKNMAFKNLT